MKAITNEIYGGAEVLKLKEVEKPIPKENEVLVKVKATAINYADQALLTGKPFLVRLMGEGLLKPKSTILGADVAGIVEGVGSKVKSFQIGDAVYGDMADCGFGGLAEYACAPEDTFVIKPESISFEQAAAVPMAAVTALKGLRDKCDIEVGQKVLINGASGGVGTFAVQIAKALGAEVTAVCSSSNIEIAKKNGADYVIDYSKEDFTKSGKQYDVILGANGFHSLKAYRDALTPKGTYVATGGKLSQIFQAMLIGPLMSKKKGRKFSSVASKPSQKDLSFINQLMIDGKIIPTIDRQYPLSETAEAFQYLEMGHAKGKIVIQIS